MKAPPVVLLAVLLPLLLSPAQADDAQSDYATSYRSGAGGFAFALDSGWGRIEPPANSPMTPFVEVMFWHEGGKSTLSLVKLPLKVAPEDAERRLGFLLGQLIPGFDKQGTGKIELGGRTAQQIFLCGSRSAEWGPEEFEVTCFLDRAKEASFLLIIRGPQEGDRGTAAPAAVYPTFAYGPRPRIPAPAPEKEPGEPEGPPDEQEEK